MVPETVAAHPRAEVGKVVLRRACWVAPVGQVPDRERGESDAGYWVRLLRWIGANGIPMQCFMRILSGDIAAGVDADRDGYARLLDKSRKPLYVDFTNWYLVLVFQRALSGSGSVVVFEEALPAPEQARFPAEDPAATEFLVEISRSAGRDG